MIRVSLLFLALLMASCAFFSQYPLDDAETTPVALPDLAVIYAQNSYYPICMGSCSELSVMAIIQNQGSVDAPPFEALLNGVRVHSDGIPAGQQIMLIAPMTTAPNVSVIVDPENAITEISESNNSLTTMTLTLTPPMPCAAGVCE